MEAQGPHRQPFSLSDSRTGLARLWAPVVERLVGLSELNRIYDAVASQMSASPSPRFCFAALTSLGVPVPECDLSSIPQRGPLVIVANHPLGALEGLVLECLVAAVRPDVKVLSNHLLARVPQARATSIFVDPFGGSRATHRNIRPLREALAWLKSGGALVAFPAGEVAHFQLRAGRVVEPAWNANIAAMARRTGATVVPAWVAGRNSAIFQVAGLIHPRLRTLLLPREFLRRRGAAVRVRFGSAIAPVQIRRMPDDGAATAFLRLRTLMLADESGGKDAEPDSERGWTRGWPPVVAAGPVGEIERDIRGLPDRCLLEEGGDFQVFAAEAASAPAVLREIGRLREVTFREVGEGSGHEIDLDPFDGDYLHLFVWDRRARVIVGAYRLGFTDRIAPGMSRPRLYTKTLFRYNRRLLSHVGPAIELGRSFVRAEYQKNYWALLLLWRGIAKVVSRQPRYRHLFGVVSISADYDDTTKRLLMSFLKLNNFDARLAGLVVPRTPARLRRSQLDIEDFVSRVAHDIDDVDELVREIEHGHRAVPVLLRQYLRLNARVLGFNVDPAFGNVLDALMLIDLTRVDRPILDRFFGREAAQQFLDHHADFAAGRDATASRLRDLAVAAH